MVKFDRKLYTFTKHHVKDLLTYKAKNRALYSKDEHLKLLLTASLVNGFAEGVSRSLSSVPTGETLLSYVKCQDQQKLQNTFDEIVRRNVQELRKRRKLLVPVPMAIDWHDVMYYGDPKTPMVTGTQHKKGSNYAYQYLTASVLVDGERVVVTVLPVSKRNVYLLVRAALQKIEKLGIIIQYVTLDGGFFSRELLMFLEETGVRYIIHMPSTMKTKRMRLWNGRRFTYKTNNHSVGHLQQASFDVVVAYDKRKKYRYLFATNMHYCSRTILRLFNKRWGIETTYRMCNQFLIKTTSKAYTVRLFYYLLACAIYNVWVLYNNEEHIPVIQMKIALIMLIWKELEGKDT